MNRITFLPAIILAFLFAACQDSRENQNSPLSEKDTYKTIGEKIPFETGMEWIEFYRKQNPQQARISLLTPYNASAGNMDSLLTSAASLVGVAFHYALDDYGKKHIIVIPVDESLSLWAPDSGRLLLDANTDNFISFDVAARWADHYKKAKPDNIWFHFFGKQVMDDMQALPYFDNVEIEPAINILTLKPQLLLVIRNNSLIPFGRIAGDDDDGTVYDASNPCPPCAVH